MNTSIHDMMISSLPSTAAMMIRRQRRKIRLYHYSYCCNNINNQNHPCSLRQMPFLILILLLLCTTTHALGIDTGGNASTYYDDIQEPIDYAPPRFAVLFPWFIQIIGVITFFIITRYELIIPFQAIMFIFGAISGIVSTIRYNAIDTTTSYTIVDELDQLSISILQWSTIDSAVLLLVFLPGLIFRDAIEGKYFMIFFDSFVSLILYICIYVLIDMLTHHVCFSLSLTHTQHSHIYSQFQFIL